MHHAQTPAVGEFVLLALRNTGKISPPAAAMLR
jgi:hypothetical protein